MSRHLILLLSLLLSLTACQGEESQPETTGPQTEPAVEVNLPPVPDLNVDRPLRYPDGSISVWALTQRMREYLGQTVRVTGYVTDIYICEFREQMEASDRMIRYRNYLTEEEMAQLALVAAGTGEGAEGEGAEGEGGVSTEGVVEGTGETVRCNYPHLFIADSMNTDLDLLVTGYGVPMEQRLVMGERYLFEGRYLEETRGFNAAGRGLVYVRNISGGNLDLPPAPGEEQGMELR